MHDPSYRSFGTTLNLRKSQERCETIGLAVFVQGLNDDEELGTAMEDSSGDTIDVVEPYMSCANSDCLLKSSRNLSDRSPVPSIR